MTARLVPALLIVFAAIYLWQTSLIPLDPWSADEAITARTLPYAYGVVLLALAFIRLVTAARVEGGLLHGSLARLAWVAALIVVYGLLIPRIGIWPATALFTGGCLTIEGEHRPTVVAGVPIGLVLLGYALIEGLLDVYLPPGIWLEALIGAAS